MRTDRFPFQTRFGLNSILARFNDDGGDPGDNGGDGGGSGGGSGGAAEVEITPELVSKVLETDAAKQAIAAAVNEQTQGLKSKNSELLGKLDDMKQYRDQVRNLEADQELAEAVRGGDREIKSLLDSRVESARADMKTHLNERDQRIAELEQQIADGDARLKSFRLRDTIGRAASANERFLPSASDDLLVRAERVWGIDEQGNLEPRDEKGNVIIGRDGNAISPEEWVATLAESAPHFFKAARGSGGRGGNGGPAGKTFTRAEWQQKMLSADDSERQKLLAGRQAGEITITK